MREDCGSWEAKEQSGLRNRENQGSWTDAEASCGLEPHKAFSILCSHRGQLWQGAPIHAAVPFEYSFSAFADFVCQLVGIQPEAVLALIPQLTHREQEKI